MNSGSARQQCIHCKACTKFCEFLKKYNLDIGDTEKLKELAYHCFLCGRCKEVCPRGIDGRKVILDLRRERTKENNDKITEGGYDLLIKEKQDYIFRNYQHITEGSVLFTGCNFPSFYPKTTRKIERLLREAAGVGVIYDCCGKPISELGLKNQEEKLISGLNDRLANAGVKEVITLCPNCYYFLRGRIEARVVTIYEFLKRIDYKGTIEKQSIPVFPPCPDRAEKIWQKDIAKFVNADMKTIEEMPCCGLGGCARAKEPEISKGYSKEIAVRAGGSIYTYCASCAGKFARDGMEDVHHMLPELLETMEQPDISKSLVNRAMSRFW